MKVIVLFFLSEILLAKKPRKAMGAMEPPKTTGDVMVAPNNAPQISGPRVLVKNMPKPNDRAYSYPQRKLVG